MEKKSFFAYSKLKAALGYIISLFILSMVFIIFIGAIIAKSRGMDVRAVVDGIMNSAKSTEETQLIYTEANGWASLIAYLLSLTCIIIWMRQDFITDYQALKENKKFYLIWIPIFSISFLVLALGIDHVAGRIMDSSDNQKTIINMLNSSACIPTIVSTVLLAPVVEEMIYRKAIFSVFKKVSLIPAYITSVVLFTLPHMLSTTSSFGVWIMQCIPYALCGLMLCFIYHKSKFNIYASITAHILNNLVAVLWVIIAGGLL